MQLLLQSVLQLLNTELTSYGSVFNLFFEAEPFATILIVHGTSCDDSFYQYDFLLLFLLKDRILVLGHSSVDQFMPLLTICSTMPNPMGE